MLPNNRLQPTRRSAPHEWALKANVVSVSELVVVQTTRRAAETNRWVARNFRKKSLHRGRSGILYDYSTSRTTSY